jgi:hypothetical protein
VTTRLDPRAALLSVLALGAIAAAGCGGDDNSSSTTAQTRTVDDQQIEQGIKQQLSTSDNAVTKVSCPADVEVQQGGTFNCSVTYANGATGKVTVTQKGANNYTYALKPGSVQVPGSTVEAEINKDLAAQGVKDPQSNCPDNIIVKTGTTVTCDVSSAGATGSVMFSLSASGTVDSSSVETG